LPLLNFKRKLTLLLEDYNDAAQQRFTNSRLRITNDFYIQHRQFSVLSEERQDEHRIPEAPGRRSLGDVAALWSCRHPKADAGRSRVHPAMEKSGENPPTFASPSTAPRAPSFACPRCQRPAVTSV